MTKEILNIELATNLAPEISASLWRLEDCRERTFKALKDLPEAALDWEAANYPNSIGSLLYHIAAIEADWLYTEVIQGGFETVEHWFPYPVRDKSGRLFVVKGHSLKEYLNRLEAIRQEVRKTFRVMRLEDFRTTRELEHYHVTPEWVLHHLAQHEAEHRGEILSLRELYKAE